MHQCTRGSVENLNSWTWIKMFLSATVLSIILLGPVKGWEELGSTGKSFLGCKWEESRVSVLGV